MTSEAWTWPTSEWHRCGRPTKTGKLCRQRRYESAPACNRHLTAEEIAENKLREHQRQERLAKLDREPPACWTWPVTDADREQKSLYHWQAGRCAICACPYDVLDHDHDTAWVRGYLCRGCNISESANTSLTFQRYRKWNPARILGIWHRYDNPVLGLARTRWSGEELWRAVPVAPDGTVLFYVEPALERDSRLTAGLMARLAARAAQLDDNADQAGEAQ